MIKACAMAFKEWAVIVQALLDGRQILILRKGGISEDQGRFNIEGRAFFLYPTKVHQSPKGLINTFAQFREGSVDQQVIAAAEGPILEDRVKIKAFAEVGHYERVTDIARIKALRTYHVWSDKLIEQRFRWGNEDWLDVFLLKVFRLPRPIELKNNPKFAGCKSWIHLETPLSTVGALEVVPEKRFRQESSEILSILAKTTSAA